MPPKEAVKKNHAGGDMDSGVTTGSKGKDQQRVLNNIGILDDSGKSTRSDVVANEKSGKDRKQVPDDVIVLDDAGNDAEAARAAAEAALRDIEMQDASVKEKVSRSADEFEKLFYKYGEQLMAATQVGLEQAKGVDAQTARAISNSWSQVKKQMQPALNRCLGGLVNSVPDSDETVQEQEVARPGIRAVPFRDLLENARTDVTGSLEELIKWFATHSNDPVAITSMADHKLAAYTQVYNAVLDKMGRDILDRMADAGSAQIDFGRDSDYGQALQSQQALARERDELQLQLEAFQKQVEHLKASEADLYAKCTELQEKFSEAQKDLIANDCKLAILKSVTTFLGTDDANVVGTLAEFEKNFRGLEVKVAELESHECTTDNSVFQEDSSRIAYLELQLRSAQGTNVKLQRTNADYEKQLASSSGGTNSGSPDLKSILKGSASHSKNEHATSGSHTTPPAGSFSGHPEVKASTPPSRTSTLAGSCSDSITAREVIELFARNQSVPAPPPLKVFFGDYKEDKMGLPEFLRMYKHRYGPCSEETKVDMLGEYLAGEAKRVYRSIVSSWDGPSCIPFAELESRMRNLMLDNSRTGVLLRQERVHGLRMKDDESYLSFITFLETKACEAYEDASLLQLDGVKVQVLLKNIRSPTLALQVEHALRTVPEGSPLFPTAKDLVIAYERTEKQSRQWNRNSGSTQNNGKSHARSKYQGKSPSQQQSNTQPTSVDSSTPAQSNSSDGSAPTRQVPRCYKCKQLGHVMRDCPGSGAPQLTGGNAGSVKFGNSNPVKCHECGELGHSSLS